MTRLTFSPNNHSYWLADDRGKRSRVPSVSALKKTLHVFDNDGWKAGQIADAAAEEWNEISALPPTSRRDRVVGVGLARLAEAREFGTAVHHYCEQLWGGQAVEVPEAYAAHVAAVADWWQTERVRLAHAECMCWADADPEFGLCAMAGRVDLLVEHPRHGLGLLDLKTWRPQSSGSPRPEEWAFQLASYASMEQLVVDDSDRPFPAVRWLGVLHVGPGSADLWTVTPPGWSVARDQVSAARALKAIPKPRMEKGWDDENAKMADNHDGMQLRRPIHGR